MREFCWGCNRPLIACFCKLAHPFESAAEFAVIVHPHEAKSTVGTAWILRKSITNLRWLRTNGLELDQDNDFAELLNTPGKTPLLLYPGSNAFNLNQGSHDHWKQLVNSQLPVFIVIDGTWSQARTILKRSKLLRNLPRISFETTQLSEYKFKRQPRSHCLSSVEGVHRVIEILASRGWGQLPPLREHDQMIEIFRQMVRFQTNKADK